VPALRALSDDFETVGVANTSLKSAEAAAAAFGPPRAFESAAALIASPEIDVVIVTVKVPHHREVVTAALQNSKSVYCEWPYRGMAVFTVAKGGLMYAATISGQQFTDTPRGGN